AVLRLPLVVGRNADAGLPADVLDRHAGVGLLEDRDDLGLGETGLLHGTSWLGKTCQKVLLMGCLRTGEAYVQRLRGAADLRRNRHDRLPARRVLTLVVENQPHRALAHF